MYNILYIDSNEFIGGGQVSLKELIRLLDRKNFNPIAVLPEKSLLACELKKLNITIELLNLPSFKAFNVLSIFHLIRIIKKNKIDLIHANTSRAMLYAIISTKFCHRPTIWHVRVADRDNPLYDFMLYKSADRVITVSHAVKNRFGRFNQNKTTVIYNGVDIDIFTQKNKSGQFRKESGLSDSDFLIGVIGRISPEKGLEYLIQAIPEMSAIIPSLKVVVVGAGEPDYVSRIKTLSNELRLDKDIIFTGFRPDIPAIINDIDLICLPSTTEGFNRTIMEAMAVGKPVIATEVGGNKEIIKSGTTGILIPPSNSKAISEAVINLYNNKDALQKIASSARNNVEQFFNIRKTVMETENLYRQVLI